jgi:methionyl-tRNA synthetase
MSSSQQAAELFEDATGDIALGNLEAAVEKYRACVDLDPDFFEAWHALGMALMKSGHYPEAITAGLRAVELQPNDQLAWSSLSLFYVRNNQIPEAEAAGAKARVLSWGGKLRVEEPGSTRPIAPPAPMTSASPATSISQSFFLTTAIDYTNGAPHLGHAYEKVLADVLARHHRQRGERVFFLTGVDQHGQKVQQSAEKRGVEPAEFVAEVTAQFVALWEKLGLAYDGWAATTDATHKGCVQKILTRLNAEGQIYKDKRGGYYSIRQEQFLTDKERNEVGEFGPEWGEVEFREEENYYFRLAEHKGWLLDLIDRRSASGAPLVVPEFRVAELRNAVEKLEGDLCISRPKSRLLWGIEFPFDPDFVTYVWFDALVNYISFAPGYDPTPGADLTAFRTWWPALHIIGKDILVPAHGVYWPIMLKALGFADSEIPTLLVHGWWNIGGAKMSKSLGNSIDPSAIADKYGPEALRYYLTTDIATGRDADFSEERLVQRANTDLANNLGNLLNRTLNMAWKYREGRLTLGDATLRERGSTEVARQTAAYAAAMDRNAPETALAAAGALAVWCNGLVEETAPWKLAKDPAEAAKLDAVLYTLAECLRVLAHLFAPVVPQAAVGLLTQLQWTPPVAWSQTAWGGLPDGHQLGRPVPLFPRLEPPATE